MVGQDSQDIKDAVMDELKGHFRPEFLNRIDETVVFHGLGAAHIASIAEIQLRVLAERLARLDLTLQVSPPALAELAKVGFDPVFPVRATWRCWTAFTPTATASSSSSTGKRGGRLTWPRPMGSSQAVLACVWSRVDQAPPTLQ
jgi:hypothetical protein